MSAVEWTAGAKRLRADDLLGPVVRRHGHQRIDPAGDFFDRFVRSVIRQQVSMAAADAIYDRLAERYPVTPPAIRDADPASLREAGLSTQKAATIRELAIAFQERDWSRESFANESNDAIIAELTTVTGVGVWTAKMQLIFSLGRPDVFPVEDLGIRRAMHHLADEELTRAEMREMAERWRPDRSLAALYLWNAEDR